MTVKAPASWDRREAEGTVRYAAPTGVRGDLQRPVLSLEHDVRHDRGRLGGVQEYGYEHMDALRD